MINRWIATRIENIIASEPAVVLLGPRQVGKTTLAKYVGTRTKSIYLDLESQEGLLQLQDSTSFLRSHSDKLVILDEIQNTPDLFMVLRGLIDANREKGREGNQYLILGSASVSLLRQTSQSLAGRISYVEMSGLNALEIESSDTQNLWLRGGFPRSYLAVNDEKAMFRLEQLIRTYLERDIPQLVYRVPAGKLRRLWTMLAHSQGEPLNISKLATNLELDSKTASNYVQILVDLLLVRQLEPWWHPKLRKRLVKSPRYYIRDSGILHRLLGINNHSDLLSHPVLGKSWEGFVIENIHSVLPVLAETYYFRTAAGSECDLVIKLPYSGTWAVEIKYGVAPKLSKHNRRMYQDIGATQKFVVYSGTDEFPIANDTTVISLTRFMKKLERAK